jgi:Lrp/AsnC family transcriptional regulator for asnA, asnC and gidA
MDEIDRRILRILQEDGRVPFTEIAARTGLADSTVRARYRALVEDGLVRTVGIVDPYALGFQAPAIIAISIEPGLIDAVARQIVQVPEVSYLVTTLGSYDLIVEVFCRNVTHLSNVLKEKIREIDGVRATETLMIAQSYKLSYRWTPPSNAKGEGAEDLQALVKG